MTAVIWEEPTPSPTSRNAREAWAAIAADLRRNPNRWAKIATKPTQASAAKLGTSVRKSLMQSFRPASDFEVTVRQCDVYCRFIGESGGVS